jgi:hypothetical protein
MTSDRKHPSATFWLTVALFAVLVGYPLSFGPAGWIYDRCGKPPWMFEAGQAVYAPLWWTWQNGPEWLQRGIYLYGIGWWPTR